MAYKKGQSQNQAREGIDPVKDAHFVDCDTGAQNWGSIGEWQIIWNWGELGSVGDSELLEGTVDGVSGALSRLAQRFVSLSAELAFL